MPTNRGFATILVIILLGLLVAGGTYYATRQNAGLGSVNQVPVPATSTAPQTSVAVQTVEKIDWHIEKAHAPIADPNDPNHYRNDEQAISVDVTLSDKSTRQYNVDTAYGCTGSNTPSTEGDKQILGKVNCYYALTGVGFVAYTQNGRFVVERQDESAKDGSIKTAVVLEMLRWE